MIWVRVFFRDWRVSESVNTFAHCSLNTSAICWGKHSHSAKSLILTWRTFWPWRCDFQYFCLSWDVLKLRGNIHCFNFIDIYAKVHTNPTSVVTFLECKWYCQNAALSLFVNIILQEGRLCNSLTFDALFPPFVQIFSLLAGKFQGRAWQGIYYFDFSDSWAQQTFGASERLCYCVGGGFTKLFRFIKWINSVKSFKSWRSIVSPSSELSSIRSSKTEWNLTPT